MTSHAPLPSSSDAAPATAAASMVVSPPRRFIYTEADMKEFDKSPAKKELLRVVAAMGKSCSESNNNNGNSSHYEYDPSQPLRGLPPAMVSLYGSLSCMEKWLADLPPDPKAQARFGNPIFAQWHARLVDRSAAICSSVLKCRDEYSSSFVDDSLSNSVLQTCLERGFQAAAETTSSSSTTVETTNTQDNDASASSVVLLELRTYLHDAFGHPIRLDYGTGHESSFMVFLYALLKLGCFGNATTPDQPPSSATLKAVTIAIWTQYLHVTRGLQMEYMLEPAGSHGVWGLDDYHCLPFYFGACQLIPFQHEYNPQSIHDDSVMSNQDTCNKFLYFGCIQYIRQLKRNVPFFESSPMLNDISHLPSWSKVATGLLKLYQGEVLDKRPVVQHFTFGNIFKATWTPSYIVEPRAPTEVFRVSTTTTEGTSRKTTTTTNETANTTRTEQRATTVAAAAARTPPSSMTSTRAPWAK